MTNTLDASATDLPIRLKEVRLAVTSQAIRLYAEITEDFNPIHLDAEFAKNTQMGGIIAHGTMSLNLVWQSLAASIGDEQTRLVKLDVRFIRPVRLQDVVASGGVKREDGLAYNIWVRNQDGEDVITGLATLRDKVTHA